MKGKGLLLLGIVSFISLSFYTGYTMAETETRLHLVAKYEPLIKEQSEAIEEQSNALTTLIDADKKLLESSNELLKICK